MSPPATIVSIVLGSCFGLFLALVLIYFSIRRRRNRGKTKSLAVNLDDRVTSVTSRRGDDAKETGFEKEAEEVAGEMGDDEREREREVCEMDGEGKVVE